MHLPTLKDSGLWSLKKGFLTVEGNRGLGQCRGRGLEDGEGSWSSTLRPLGSAI